MSSFVEWIAAEGRRDPLANPATGNPSGNLPNSQSARASHAVPLRNLPAHNFPASTASSALPAEATSQLDFVADPDLWLYRSKTVSVLHRYMRWSLEAGRVPSLLGREFFRSQVTSYSASTFEDKILFLYDVERCLDRLDDFDQQLIARAILQEHTHEATARFLHCTRRTVERRLPGLLDELSDAFLRAQLLTRLPQTKDEPQ
jgi:hypothetical protein